MRFFTRIAILFYVMTISLISGVVIFFVAHLIDIKDVNFFLDAIYRDTQLGGLVGLASALFILLSFMFARLIAGSQQKERTIAFDNPSGRVSVSLTAIEEMIRRLIGSSPEVKEVRAHVRAVRKGIEIESRIILNSDVNIPELTAKLQDRVRRKIRETIGMEDKVTIRIHVNKIILQDAKSKGRKDKLRELEEKTEPHIPFQGYRA